MQAGGPPIMIGGSGEKRTLKIVAKYADLCNISGDAATVRHKLGVLREHCDAVGRDPSEITATRLATLLLTSSADETKQMREFLAQAAGPEAAAGFNVGQADEIVEQVGELVDAGLDTLIFNMPLSAPDAVKHAGAVLTERVRIGRRPWRGTNRGSPRHATNCSPAQPSAVVLDPGDGKSGATFEQRPDRRPVALREDGRIPHRLADARQR